MGVEGVSADVARRRWRGVPVRGGAAPERPPEDGEDIAKGKGKRVHTPSGSFPSANSRLSCARGSCARGSRGACAFLHSAFLPSPPWFLHVSLLSCPF